MTAKKTPLPLGSGNMTQVAGVLGIQRQTFAEFVEQGRMPKGVGKLFDVQVCVTAYIEILRGERAANTKAAAQNVAQIARAREIEQRIAERDRELIPVADAIAAVDDIVGVVLTELNSLPAAVTRDVPLRRQIESKVDDAQKRITGALDKAAHALRAGGEASEAEAEDAAGQVGG